jgi:hypothetical protein
MLFMFCIHAKNKVQSIYKILLTDPALVLNMIIRLLPPLLFVLALSFLCASIVLIVALKHELLLSRMLCSGLELDKIWVARCLRSLLDDWWRAHCFVEQQSVEVVAVSGWRLW